jgi:hypothetical protein
MRKKIREEKDQEGGMAKVEIDSIERAVQNLKKKITKTDQQLPAWVQSKITRAADYINSASQYLMSGEELDENISFEINRTPKKPAQTDSDAAPDQTPAQRRAHQDFVEKLHNRLNSGKEPELTKLAADVRRVKAQMDAENSAQQSQPNQPKKPQGPQLPNIQKEQISLADKILEEMGCGCDHSMKPHKTAKQIAKKHQVPVEEVLKQLKAGTKVEGEHTKDKKEAEIIALQHLDERPDYYARLKKAEKTNESVSVTDMFGNVTYEFIDLIKPDPIVTEAKRKKMKGEDPCWKGYEMVGKKMKGGREVPNCVPVNEYAYVDPAKQFSNVIQPQKTIATIDRDIAKKNLQKQQELKKIRSKQMSGNLPFSGSTGLPMGEETIPMKNGQIMFITILWRGKYLGIQMFFPQTRVPNRSDVQDAVDKVYPEGRVVTYKLGTLKQDMPLIQIQNSPSKNYKLNAGIIGEEVIDEAGPSLSVSRGEKLSVEAGGGLTKKGREKYNRETGSNLKAPVTGKVKRGSKAWKRRKNFCSRSRSWNGPRGRAARRRWKC